MIKLRDALLMDCKKCSKISRIPELKAPTGEYIGEDYFKNFIDEDKLFIVAEEGHEIIGYALGEPMKGGVAYLGLLTVASKMRNKGVGKMLIEEFKKRCKEKSFNYILFYAPKFNKNTIKFYENLGFTKGEEHISFGQNL